ncbi:unnamed protein product [Adineta ricciae]|uniref:Peptide-N(4)-(N-acetyl-beta-glucosaminyl)asparagine amidase n=1 Tax=Adineta ricciae TaxID=249248 RepID=A0A814F759_ADIRI|nr:unnamed protein product [Adineta ricciae]CAF1035535.1 unnamed protein product [Adineta ricciae]
MDFAFLKHLRRITDEDERLVTITLLIDITSNLINDKANHRHHTLPASYVQEMFEKYSGAMQCLSVIGFKKINDDYVFNQTISDNHLQELMTALENELESKPADRCDQMKCTSQDLGIVDDDKRAPSLISLHNLAIPAQFSRIVSFVSTLERVQSYEDVNLRRYIRSSIVPLEDFNRRISKKKDVTDLQKRDLLLVELLRWFKEEFFTWFDRPNCERCRTVMEFADHTQPTREEREQGDAHRVELYRCATCLSEFRFPRFNAPSKLLETRTGRCGEAANLFSCLCRALAFPTRYIYDTTDHVWTEVYSESERRWLHCDACENLCDSPLVYEKGWKKELSFCIAFAKDHVMDVTWRYVTNFKLTIRRRNIDEKHFCKTIFDINRKVQSQLDQQERKQLISTQIRDLVSMLKEQNVSKESELHGRQSGSLGWKLSRGETDQQDDIINRYIFSVENSECEKGLISIEYDSVLDKYFRNKIEENKVDGWTDRVYSCSNIQRKVERDWKMVYLSRKQLNSNGFISWCIQLKPEQEEFYQFHQISIQCPTVTFDQQAKIVCQVQLQDDQLIDIPQNSNSSFEYIITEKNVYRIIFKITLSSSNDHNDNNAWQKAQLFRQSTVQQATGDQSHFLKVISTIVKKI